MRPIICLVAAFILITGCGDNNATTGEKASENTTEKKPGETTSTTNNESQSGIVGEWELASVIGDDNGNEKIDDEEKQKAITSMKDYMKLNGDGSALFYVFKKKGRYEIKTNESSGKKYLDLIDKDNFKHSKGAILSVSKDELVILNKFGGNTFTVWKRV